MSADSVLTTSNVLSFFSVLTKCYSTFNLCITFPIYVSVLAFIFRKRRQEPYNSSFYTFFLYLGVFDILDFFVYLSKKCSFWGWVLPVFYPLDKPSAAVNPVYYAMYAVNIAEELLNVLLIINRFVAICFPFFYQSKWTSNVTNWLIGCAVVVSFGLPAPLFWQPLGIKNTLITLENNETVVKQLGPTFFDAGTQKIFFTMIVTFAYAEIALCLLLTPWMWTRVRNMNLQDARQKAEAKLFYSFLFILLAHTPFAAYFLNWLWISSNPVLVHIYEWSAYVVNDLYDMTSPYGLLATSKQIRDSTLPFCLFRKDRIALIKSCILCNAAATQIEPVNTLIEYRRTINTSTGQHQQTVTNNNVFVRH